MYVLHLSKRRLSKVALPSSWDGLRTRADARSKAMCRNLTVSLYCSGYKWSDNVCDRLPGTTPGALYGLDFPRDEESLSNLH